MFLTLEPRIESSLLYTKRDGTQDFVHDKYREFFAAKWLTILYNQRVIGQKEVDIMFFYDASPNKLGIEGQYINKKIEGIILFFVPQALDYYNHFIKKVLSNWENAEALVKRLNYNPFFNDFEFIWELIQKIKPSDQKLIAEVKDKYILDFQLSVL
ncbi:hypothetical protein J4209_04640 [Candidatus Woesearchaeota archaeon]|nr:hypothetical protein [Candidatus Woesearchaeota archaeon]